MQTGCVEANEDMEAGLQCGKDVVIVDLYDRKSGGRAC